MGVHEWIRREIERVLQRAQVEGFDPALSRRALLSAAVECSRVERDVEDLAGELRFLAENLDEDRDYGFMRP